MSDIGVEAKPQGDQSAGVVAAPGQDAPALNLGDLAEHLRPAAPAAEPESPQEPEAAPTGGEDDAGGDDGEGAAAAATDAQAAPRTQRTAAEWVDIISKAPQRIQEVPRRQLAEVTAALMAESERRASQEREQGRTEAEEVTRWRQAVAEIEALDSVAFAEWARTYPERLAGYNEIKRLLAEHDRASVVDAYLGQNAMTYASRLIEPLAEHPEVIQRLSARTYTSNLAGLLQLAKDVGREEALLERTVGQVAREREQAASGARQAPPTAPLAPGGAGQGELTYERLKAMSQADVERLMASPEGKAAIDKVLLAARR